MHARSQGSTPYDMGHDERAYPLERILATAELAAGLSADANAALVAALADSDSAVRYWAATGLLMRGEAGIRAGGAAGCRTQGQFTLCAHRRG